MEYLNLAVLATKAESPGLSLHRWHLFWMASLPTSLKSSLSLTADTHMNMREATSRYGFLRLAGEPCYGRRLRRSPRRPLWLLKRGVVTPSCCLAHMLVMRSKRALWERLLNSHALRECPWPPLLSATLYSRHSCSGPHTITSKGMWRCYHWFQPGLNTPGLSGNVVELSYLVEKGVGIHFPRKKITVHFRLFTNEIVFKYGMGVLLIQC